MIAYLRLFPKTLIAGWSSGTGVSGIISGGLNLLTQLIGTLSLDILYISLTPVGPLYFALFFWTYKLLRKTDISDMPSEQLIRETDNSKNENGEEENNAINTEENVINEDNQNNAVEPGNVDDINRLNQTMNCKNFKAVMKMCGRTIINLGIIYFSYFICISCLVIRDSEKVDLPFLPLEIKNVNETINNSYINETTNETIINQTVITVQKKYRKGKFEFINLFFQFGMFTAKTFIKVVRKIQPIEIYTGSILAITALYFLEYYFWFMPYWLFPIVNFILGCFAGGTYSGAFYTILHSGKVAPEYKELTVNVATLFNDFGTFLSGIVGYILMKFVVNSDAPFPGQEIK